MPQCTRCGQDVPETALYCPVCTGREVSQTGALWRGGLRGALLGLFAGLLPAGLIFAEYGPERGIKAIVFLLPAIGLATGLTLGLARARRPLQSPDEVELT